jgi:hypothetical protein
MILDSYCKLSDGQAATTADTSYSDYSFDCGSITPKRDIGNGEPMAIVVSVTGSAATVSADTFTFTAITSTSATDLSTGVKELCKRLIPGASLTAGSRHVFPIPPGSVDQRYIGMRYVLGSGDAVTVDADLVPMSFIGIQTKYADGVVWEE